MNVADAAEQRSLIEEMQTREAVLAAFGDVARHIDEAITGAGLDSAAAVLAGLKVRGLVRQRPGKNFLRRPSAPHTVREDAGGTTWPNHSSS